MEKYSVNNEENNYGVNKFIRELLASNGHYENGMLGDDFLNSKFGIIIPPNDQLGIPYLRLKFRERGLDISDLTYTTDISRFVKDGISSIKVDFKIHKYEKKEGKSNNLVHHSRSKELNELEKQKELAKQNNDIDAYNYAQEGIRNIIRNSRYEISQEKWNTMSNENKKSFFKIKMNESRILQDQDEFNYWRLNLDNLDNQFNQEEQSGFHR